MTTLIRALAAAALLALATLPDAPAQAQAPAFSPEQERALGPLVRDYLLRNPEVLREALEALQEKESRAEASRQADALAARKAELESDPADPVMGNPDGDVTIVEFFDYRCPYCRAVVPTLHRLLKEDPKLRVVLKELPILGPDSVVAAKAAVAAGRQGKYMAMHDALMTAPGRLEEPLIMRLAAEKGLDVARLKRDMESAETIAALNKVRDLAMSLGIGGTPAFVIGGTLAPGALDHATFVALIDKARAK